MLPGLAILAARGAIGLAKGIRMPRVFPWIVAAVALGNAAIFLLSDTPISARDVARHDRGIEEKAAFVRSMFVTETTVVVTAYDAVLVDYYLDRSYVVLAYELTLEHHPTLVRDAQHSDFKWLAAPELLAMADVHQNTKAYFE